MVNPKTVITPEFTEQFAARLKITETGVADFASSLRRNVEQDSQHVVAAFESYLSLLERGGKRMRGVLAATGYHMRGGNSTAVAVAVAGAMEAMHASLLVIDDVADAADQRRGGPAAHTYMAEYLQTNGLGNGSTRKLGEDIAIAAAMSAKNAAQSHLVSLPEIPAELCQRAAFLLNEGLVVTGKGQILDMLLGASSHASQSDILTAAERKTAYYSFQLPIQVGATLAGATQAELDYLLPYSINAGVAFQLQDDIISTFGNEAQTGKPSKNDIMEGKKTFLVSDALEHASPADTSILLAALGNRHLSNEGFEKCLDIVRQTGALDRTTNLVASYSRQAQACLLDVPSSWDPDDVQFLRDIVAFSAQRSH